MWNRSVSVYRYSQENDYADNVAASENCRVVCRIFCKG